MSVEYRTLTVVDNPLRQPTTYHYCGSLGKREPKGSQGIRHQQKDLKPDTCSLLRSGSSFARTAVTSNPRTRMVGRLEWSGKDSWNALIFSRPRMRSPGGGISMT